MNIDVVWKNIQLCEGETFQTVRGVSYSYVFYGDYILINDDKRRRITKEHFAKAIEIINPSSSKLSRENIWGPSYVCGMITDKRIMP